MQGTPDNTATHSGLVLGVAGALASLVTGLAGLASCCLGPLAFMALGSSSMLASAVEPLQAWQPIFILVAFSAMAYAGWALYRPVKCCNNDQAPEDRSTCLPRHQARTRAFYWITVTVIIMAILVPHVVPVLAGWLS